MPNKKINKGLLKKALILLSLGMSASDEREWIAKNSANKQQSDGIKEYKRLLKSSSSKNVKYGSQIEIAIEKQFNLMTESQRQKASLKAFYLFRYLSETEFVSTVNTDLSRKGVSLMAGIYVSNNKLSQQVIDVLDSLPVSDTNIFQKSLLLTVMDAKGENKGVGKRLSVRDLDAIEMFHADSSRVSLLEVLQLYSKYCDGEEMLNKILSLSGPGLQVVAETMTASEKYPSNRVKKFGNGRSSWKAKIESQLMRKIRDASTESSKIEMPDINEYAGMDVMDLFVSNGSTTASEFKNSIITFITRKVNVDFHESLSDVDESDIKAIQFTYRYYYKLFGNYMVHFDWKPSHTKHSILNERLATLFDKSITDMRDRIYTGLQFFQETVDIIGSRLNVGMMDINGKRFSDRDNCLLLIAQIKEAERKKYLETTFRVALSKSVRGLNARNNISHLNNGTDLMFSNYIITSLTVILLYEFGYIF